MKQRRFWVGLIALAIAGCGSSTPVIQGKPPVIQNIQGESLEVKVSGGIRLKSQVSSETGNLTYSWRADHGLIATPTQATTMWIAPDRVPYTPFPVTIQLTVKDEYGRTDKASHLILVHR